MDLVLIKSTTNEFEFYIPPEVSEKSTLRSIPLLKGYLDSKGFDIDFFDADQNKNELLNYISINEPKAVGFYSSLSSFGKVAKYSQQVKEAYPDITVIVGGPYIGWLRKAIFDFDGIDIGIRGEGELALEEVLTSEKEGRGIKDVPGIIYQDHDTGVGMFPDLDKLPNPDWSLFFPSKNYIPVAYIEGARGCAYKCAFCNLPQQFPTRRVKNTDNVIAEIKSLNDLGVSHFIFTDPFLEPKSVKDLSEKMSDVEVGAWTGYAKPGSFSQELLNEFVKSGGISLFWGGESGDETILKRFRKPPTSVLIDQEQKAREAGVNSVWSFIALSPGETIDGVMTKTYDLIMKMNPPMVTINPFWIDPFSEIYLKSDEWGVEMTIDNWAIKVHEIYSGIAQSMAKLKSSGKPTGPPPSLDQIHSFIKKLVAPYDYFKVKSTGLTVADTLFASGMLKNKLRATSSINSSIENYQLVWGMSLGGSVQELLEMPDISPLPFFHC